MSRLHIPRYWPRQLVRVSSVYIFLDEPVSRVLARMEEILTDTRDLSAPHYIVRILSGPHSGELHTVPEAALEQ